MQAAGLVGMPIPGGGDVAQGIQLVVDGHLGEAGGAGGEVDQQGIGVAGAFLAPAAGIEGAFQGGLGVQVDPAGPAAAGQEQALHAGAIRQGGLHGGQDARVVGADDEPGGSGVAPVADVVGEQLGGGGDHHGAQLAQGYVQGPILIGTPHDQQHRIPLFQALAAQHIGDAGALVPDVRKGEAAALAHSVHMEQGEGVRRLGSDGVYYVEPKVEVLGRGQFEALAEGRIVPGVRLDESIAQHRCALLS